jgi:MFS family permease
VFANAARWRAAVLICVSAIGASLPTAAVAPGMSLMAAAMGEGQHGVFLAQQFMTVPGLAMMLSAPLMGWCIERVGYRPMLLWGLFIFTLCGLAAYVIQDPWLLIASRFVMGVAAVANLTPTYALASYYFEGRARDRLLGYMSGASAVLGIAVSQLAAKMVTAFGWRSVFLLFALTLPPLLIGWFAITDSEGERTPIKPPPAVAGEKAPLGALLGIYVFGAWMSLLSTNATVQIPFLFAERGLTDPFYVSLVISTLSGTMIVVAPFYGWLAARLSARMMLAFMVLIFALGHFLVGLFDAATVTIASAAFFGIGSFLIQPVCTGYVMAASPPSTHGRALGGFLGVSFLGTFLNPFVMQPVISAVHLGPAFTVVGVFNVALALAIVAAPLLFRRSGVKS